MVVYVRQSTWQQVIDHGESTRLQYALVERAVGLGWAASRVMVIDEDLGKSGSSAIGRVGFQRLVTEITMGHVGLVLGIEMSRLARSGKDWYQLLELYSLSGALLVLARECCGSLVPPDLTSPVPLLLELQPDGAGRAGTRSRLAAFLLSPNGH